MSKETIYDQQINPLMAKILELCKEHKIAMLADFMLEEDLHCTSALLSDEYLPSEAQLGCYELLKPESSFAMAITEETNSSGGKKITMRRIS